MIVEFGPLKRITILSVLALIGLVLLIVCSIPVPSVAEVISTSFTVSPGSDFEVYYHTHIFFKSVLKGEVAVEGEGVYLTAHGYNTRDLSNIVVKKEHTLTVDPAHDLYTFVFNNTEGRNDCSVQFRLEETWTRPISIGSPQGFAVALIGLFLFLAGIIGLSIGMLRRRKVSLASASVYFLVSIVCFFYSPIVAESGLRHPLTTLRIIASELIENPTSVLPFLVLAIIAVSLGMITEMVHKILTKRYSPIGRSSGTIPRLPH